jgi:hypothetical protein
MPEHCTLALIILGQLRIVNYFRKFHELKNVMFIMAAYIIILCMTQAAAGRKDDFFFR